MPVLAVLLHDQVRLLDSSGVGGGGGQEFAHQQALAWFIEISEQVVSQARKGNGCLNQREEINSRLPAHSPNGQSRV